MYAAKSKFLSTPSVRRATRPASITTAGENNFYPRPPRGGRLPQQAHTGAGMGDFYPRPPRGGRHRRCHRMSLHKTISIHALREEGDVSATSGEQTRSISIHALREEGDASLPEGLLRRSISIHALREEGDICCQQHSAHRPISIHALREEGDVSAHRWQGIQEHFYPRPPRGGRLNTNIANGFAGVFLSTPSARRATCILSFLMLLYQIFLSTPSARRATPASVGFAVAVFRFLSTHSARRATMRARLCE